VPGDGVAGAEFLDAQAVVGPDAVQEVVDEFIDGQGLFWGPIVGDLRRPCAPQLADLTGKPWSVMRQDKLAESYARIWCMSRG